MEFIRGRRLRRNPHIRDMVAETDLSLKDLIYPLFIVEGENVKEEISSMEGICRFSIDKVLEEIGELLELGLNGFLLFGIPDKKDTLGSEAYNDNGIIQRAIRKIKEKYPTAYIITDVCMCEYTSHGHCGILDRENYVQNDVTLDYLSKIALSHAKAGADMVAPSDMMDGRVQEIRKALDENGFESLPIMAYSAKYSSNFYGPFRDAADSSPAFGDRKTYQMDYRNSDEAIREIESDLDQGADLLIVKPALSYLDIIYRAKEFSNVPIVAYNVSGEYSMLKSAIEKGYLNQDVIKEVLLSIKRAGAKLIITYFAKDLALERSKNVF